MEWFLLSKNKNLKSRIYYKTNNNFFPFKSFKSQKFLTLHSLLEGVAILNETTQNYTIHYQPRISIAG